MNSRFWTFNTLLAAFLDLFIAYFLLCGSTVALLAVKFLGLNLGSNYKSLLVDYPNDKVSCVRFSISRKFPFDLIFGGVCNGNLEHDLNLELEGEASCNSKYENGIDDCVSSSSNWVTCVDQESNNGEEDGGEPECSSVSSAVNNGNDVVFSDPNAQKKIPPNEADKDKMILLLTRELEQSQAARAALYVELEKERSAAASAADEAMSMILRLQEQKAVVKMESRQYQRMIEEKSVYDAEEMNLLKEIVLRREREKHFLEKQVEAYRQLISVENNRDFIQDQDLMLHPRFFEDVDFSKQTEPEKTIAVVGEEKGLEIDKLQSYDVHVVDDESKSSEKLNENEKQSDQEQDGSETRVGMPLAKSGLRRYSTSALDNERTRLGTEVEWLRDRLRIVQQGRVKLNFSVDNQEKETLQMELLEDLTRQLRDIRMLTEPRMAREASLPLPSSKTGLTKKRRVSLGHAKST